MSSTCPQRNTLTPRVTPASGAGSGMGSVAAAPWTATALSGWARGSGRGLPPESWGCPLALGIHAGDVGEILNFGCPRGTGAVPEGRDVLEGLGWACPRGTVPPGGWVWLQERLSNRSCCPLGCQGPGLIDAGVDLSSWLPLAGVTVPTGVPCASSNVQVAAHMWKSMCEQRECDRVSVHATEFVQESTYDHPCVCLSLPAPPWSPVSSVGTAQVPGCPRTAGILPGVTSQPQGHGLSSSRAMFLSWHRQPNRIPTHGRAATGALWGQAAPQPGWHSWS